MVRIQQLNVGYRLTRGAPSSKTSFPLDMGQTAGGRYHLQVLVPMKVLCNRPGKIYDVSTIKHHTSGVIKCAIITLVFSFSKLLVTSRQAKILDTAVT